LKIASIQFKLRKVNSFEDFASHVKNFVKQAKTEGSLFVAFPEYITLELATMFSSKPIREAMVKVAEEYHNQYKNLFLELARENNMYIVAGSTLEKVPPDRYYNTSFLFTPEGEIFKHRKIHLYPDTDPMLGVNASGENLNVFQTPYGKLSVLICYDSIFPELSRILRLMGVEVIFVPSAAPFAESLYWDLRICCSARAIENQIVVVHPCLIGKVKAEKTLEFFGKSSILYPGRSKVLAEGKMNEEMVVVGEVDLTRLRRSRGKSARVLKDMRPDIYRRLCERNWYFEE